MSNTKVWTGRVGNYFAILFRALALLVAFSLCSGTNLGAREEHREDTNRDGEINVLDLLQVVLAVRQGGYQHGCDYNGDGALTVTDVSALGKAMLKGTRTPLSENLDSPQFVRILGALFMMGDSTGVSNEKPEHEVVLSPYMISKHEITNKQYAAYLNEALEMGDVALSGDTSVVATNGDYAGKELLFLAGNKSGQNRCWIYYSQGAFEVMASKANWPVVFVTWFGAANYAAHYSYRLPTEAEWECAASMAGSFAYATQDGNLDSTMLNFSAIFGNPVNVGSFPPNPNSLFDMSGNVWELFADWYGEYPDSAETNPTGPAKGHAHVRRGGGWNSCDEVVRTVAREPQDDHGHRGAGIGFRVAADIE